MPSPFPGMDPWLENPSRWQNVHDRLITYFADVLNGIMPTNYVAIIQERLVIERPRKENWPDIGVVKTGIAPLPNLNAVSNAAILEADPAWEIHLSEKEIRESYIEIVKADNQGAVVTAIEVLSPSNKKPSSDGRAQYLRKQESIQNGPTHLLEIDLLRYGCHTVSVPLDELTGRGKWDYLISLSRAPDRDQWQVWAVSVRQALPKINVPLGGEDGDVVVSLQNVFTHCFDVGRFALLVDYSQRPVPPLSAEDAVWAEALLQKGKAVSTRVNGPSKAKE